MALVVVLMVGVSAPSASRKKPRPHQRRAIAIITNLSFPATTVSMSELRAVFQRKLTRWKSGSPIIILNWAARHRVRVAFDRAVLQMSPDQVASYWIDQRIRGHRRPPWSVSSKSLILRIVARQKNVISYVPADQVNANVKVLKIDGHLPTSPRYPLFLRQKK